MDKIIGSIGICNTASINIYGIDEAQERILSGFNGDKPRWRKLYFSERGVYFNFAGRRCYLDEVMRID